MSEHDMDLQKVAKSVEEINKAWDAEKKANEERDGEIKRFGQALPETEAKLEKIAADLEKAQKVADEAVLAAKRSQRVVTDEKGNEIDLDAKAAKWAKSSARAFGGVGAAEYDADKMAEYKNVMAQYLRKGESGLSYDEVKALSVGGDADGGYVVNPDMSGRVIGRIFDTSPMRAYASVQVIGTDMLEGLHDTDEAGFGWVEETESRDETDTPQLKKWRIPVHEMYANPAATQKILDDAEIDMEGWLAGKVADRFARAEAAAFVSGSGNGQPRGYLTYPNVTTAGAYEIGAIERFTTGVDGNFAAAPNAGDVLINALHDLKAQYRANATWFMNRATTKLVRKVKDNDGAYLWSPGIAAGQPATLLGYAVAPFEDMPNPAAGSLSIAVGDMRSAYQIVDRAGIRTLRDPYTNKPYVHFYSTKRVGGDVVDFDALRLVEFSA